MDGAPAILHQAASGEDLARGSELWRTLNDEHMIVPLGDIDGELGQGPRAAAFTLLLQCFALQIRYGCDNDACTTPTCFSCHKQKTEEPIRRPTVLTARNEAFVLASTADPLVHLCPHPVRTSIQGNERVDTYQVRALLRRLERHTETPDAIEGSEGTGQKVESSVDKDIEVQDLEVPDDSAWSAPASKVTYMVKIDRASLAQNMFNTSKMASWFNPQRAQPGDTVTSATPVLVLPGLIRTEANLLAKILSHLGPDDGQRRQLITDFITRSIRFNLASPGRALAHWVVEGHPRRLASLQHLPMARIVDKDGDAIDAIIDMDNPLEHLRSWCALPNATSTIFSSISHALDAVFVPHPAIAESIGASTQAEHMPDDQAARMIFIAVMALVASIPQSDTKTLAFILQSRGQGESVPVPGGQLAQREPGDLSSIQAGVRVADAFEFPPAIRLAEKVVAALATRRSSWCTVHGERGGMFPVMSLLTAYMTQHYTTIVPRDGVEGMRTLEGHRLLRIGLVPGPIVLEFFKTVLRARWRGEYVVSRWDGAGAVLDILNDVCHLYRAGAQAWGPDDTELLIPTLSGHLKSHKAIPDYLAWMEQNPEGSRVWKNERHLLQYPFVFEPLHRTHYFRLMLYSQMHHEWRASRAARELHNQFSWLVVPGAAEYRCENAAWCNHAMCERLVFQSRQARRWSEAGYGPGQRFPSNFWNKDVYLRHKLAKAQMKFLVLDIERQTVLESAFSQLWGREHQELLKPLKIVMRMDGRDEDAADHGGVSQEFFRIVLAKAFDPEYGLFVVTEEQTRMNWFQPLSSEPLQTYELLGLLFGLAVYNGITLPVNFPYAMYQVLCGRGPIEQIMIRDAWPSLYKSFQQLAGWKKEQGDVEDVLARDYAFSFEANGHTYTVDMLKERPDQVKWPRNPGDAPSASWTADEQSLQPVTNANRLRFIQQYKMWLVLHSVRPQLEAFVTGFRHVVPAPFTSFIAAPVLKTFVEGSRHIDAAQLMAATSYGAPPPPPTATASPPSYSDDYSRLHPTVQHFWAVVAAFDQRQLQRLLTFVTASDRVPVQGYRAIGFSIEKLGDVNMLPTSSTCFGKLFLPPYESEAAVAKMLGIAINEGMAGFGFM